MTTENANPSPPGEISPAALHHNAPIMCGKGLNAENSPGFSSRERIFLLTFPFIEHRVGLFDSGPRTIWISAPLTPAVRRFSLVNTGENYLKGSGVVKAGLLIAE
jgi:hypothetical protein